MVFGRVKAISNAQSEGRFKGGLRAITKGNQIICESAFQIINKSSEWIEVAGVYFAFDNGKCSLIDTSVFMKQTTRETQTN